MLSVFFYTVHTHTRSSMTRRRGRQHEHWTCRSWVRLERHSSEPGRASTGMAPVGVTVPPLAPLLGSVGLPSHLLRSRQERTHAEGKSHHTVRTPERPNLTTALICLSRSSFGLVLLTVPSTHLIVRQSRLLPGALRCTVPVCACRVPAGIAAIGETPLLATPGCFGSWAFRSAIRTLRILTAPAVTDSRLP